jgi:hypothetical protein
VNRHHYHRRAFARLSDLSLIDAADISSQRPSNDRFAFSHCTRRQAFVSTPLSWKRIMRLVTAAVGTFIGVLATTVHAQDLEPRAYSNSPIGLNFVIAGYGYASGTVLTDPSLPLENVSNESHVGVIGFATPSARLASPGSLPSSCPTPRSPRKVSSSVCRIRVTSTALRIRHSAFR